MNTTVLINYLMYSGCLYFLYLTGFKKLSFFLFNRIYLLSVPLLAISIAWLGSQVSSPLSDDFFLAEITLTNFISTTSAENSISWLKLIYWSGFTLMVVPLFVNSIKIYLLLAQAVKKKFGSVTYYFVNKAPGPFSFFNKIVIPDMNYTKQELELVLIHENVHKTKGHSWDNMLYYAVNSFAWFNPFTHLLAYELKQLHELEADQITIAKTSTEVYASLLLSNIFGREVNIPVSPFFNSSLIKKRITMLYKKQQSSKLKLIYLLIIPVLLVLSLHSCEKKQDNHTNREDQLKNFAEVEQPPLFDNCNKNISSEEQRECFQEGLISYIANNFEYPEMAKQHGISGKMYVKFIIDEEGKIIEPVILRGLSYKNKLEENAVKQAEKYALELIAGLPQLSPATYKGKKVAISFVVPINMKLQ